MTLSKFKAANYSNQIKCNISMLGSYGCTTNLNSNRFFQQIKIISPQQISDISSACFLFHHFCKALHCDLRLTSNYRLNHCSGGTAVCLFKPGFYCVDAEAKIFSYDFIMTSSFDVCVQMFKDILHKIGVVINKIYQRLGG